MTARMAHRNHTCRALLPESPPASEDVPPEPKDDGAIFTAGFEISVMITITAANPRKRYTDSNKKCGQKPG